MPINIYSAPDCARCKTVKTFLETRHIPYQDYDSLGSGKEDFKKFYKKNRSFIYRGPVGVGFPIFSNGDIIRQGLPQVLGYLSAESRLDGYFKPGDLHGSWVDGIYISEGDPKYGHTFLEVLEHIKKHKFKIQVHTSGLNADLLVQVLEKDLVDGLIMEVKGPLKLYPVLLKHPVDPEEIKKSIRLVSGCKDYNYMTIISPIIRREGETENISYMTPDEIAQTAHLIETTTNSSTQPYRLKFYNPEPLKNTKLRDIEPLHPNQHFQYRTMARKHQFKTEMEEK